MIKIAFVIDTIESPTAGTEKQLLILLKHLDRTKFKPLLCVLRNSAWLIDEFHDGELVNIGVNSFKNPVSYLNTLKFASFLRKNKVTILQTHFVEGNKVGVIAAKLAGIKAIISTRRNQGYWHRSSELLFLKLLNWSVECFLANSGSTAEWLANKENIDPKRIEVIHNGLQLDRFKSASEEQRIKFRHEIGFPADSRVVGLVANLRPVKSIDVFIRAAKAVYCKSSTTRFLIVGDGPDRCSLEQMSAELSLGNVMRFLGQRMDVPDIMSVIDVGVLSSSSESFSNSIVEYMASGLPVVCTDVGGTREAVEDGVNGFVVNPGDHEKMAEKILAILNSPEMMNFGQRGRLMAEKKFSYPVMLTRYEQFYERVVQY